MRDYEVSPPAPPQPPSVSSSPSSSSDSPDQTPIRIVNKDTASSFSSNNSGNTTVSSQKGKGQKIDEKFFVVWSGYHFTGVHCHNLHPHLGSDHHPPHLLVLQTQQRAGD